MTGIPNEIGFIAIVIAVTGFIIGMIVCGIVWLVLSALILHYFPNCGYSKWIDDEVFHTEDLTHDPQDWISERMRK